MEKILYLILTLVSFIYFVGQLEMHTIKKNEIKASPALEVFNFVNDQRSILKDDLTFFTHKVIQYSQSCNFTALCSRDSRNIIFCPHMAKFGG